MQFRKLLLPVLSVPLIAYAQNADKILPNPGDKAYCAAKLEWPESGQYTPAVLHASRGSDGVLQLEINKAHPTYKAPSIDKDFEYGSQLASVRVKGPEFGDNMEDSALVNGKYADWDAKNNRLALSPQQSRLVRDALACFAKASTF